nr:uncharacterized protein LOC116770997 [Danaus plexippus plexippus]
MILGYILKLKGTISGNNILVQDEILGLNLTYNKNEATKYQHAFHFMVLYYSVWLAYKSIYVLALLFTLPVFFKGGHKMFKVLLYVSIPNWILDIFLSLLAIILLNYSFLLRIPLIAGLMYDGYNMLAISSEYKRVTGKLKPRYKDIEGDFRSQPLTQFSSISREDFRNIGPHCRTCKCYEPVQLDQPIAIPQTPDSIQSDTTPIINKQICNFELNYAITGVLNLDHVAEETSTRRMRPNTLDLKLNTTDDEKIVVTDEPIIYDVNQLNIGASTVIEDKEL